MQRFLESDFLPHGHCYLWQPGLIALHVVSDAAIAGAYFMIPVALLYFVRRRADVPFRWMFVMFGAFIVACGTTHLLEVWTLWHPMYWLSGAVKAGTAAISLATAAALVPLIPEALSLPSREQLREANAALSAEVAERERAERRLALVHTVLQAVNAEPDFASALRTALTTVCEATGWAIGEAWTPAADGRGLVSSETFGADEQARAFVAAGRGLVLSHDDGLVGRAWRSRKPAWTVDLQGDPSFRRLDAGVRAAFAIPVVVDAEALAVLLFCARERSREDEPLVTLVSAVAMELGSVVQRRRAENALRDSEGTLRSLFEYAPDAIVAVNRGGRIVQANLQAEAMFGYNRDELRGHSIEVLLPDRLREQHRAHRAGFSREPRRRPMGAGLRLFGLRKDGTEFPIDITLTPVEDRADGVVMAVARDMTERREARRRFRRLLESAPDAMILAGPGGRIMLVNGHAERMFGYTRQELGGQPFTLIVPPEARETAARAIAAFFREPRMIHLGIEGGPPIYGLHKDGRRVPLQVTLSPLETEVGLLAAAALRDLTERREAEAQREQLYRELHASRERLAGLSVRLLAAQESERRTIARELHDEIGQALTAVSVNLQTLSTTPDSAARDEILEESLAITQQTLRQVRTLSLDLRPSLLDDLGLGPALRWYLERQEQRLGCRIAFDDGVGDVRHPALVETTCFRLAQEALTNVVRHANARTVRVSVRRERGELVLEVADDGAGFDVAAARERASRGHSLGLLGMEERAILAGGRLEISSQPGHGTRVRARIPVDGGAAD